MVPSLDAQEEWLVADGRTNNESDLELYRTGEYADYALLCEDRAFELHSQIFCSRSIYFRDAYEGNLDVNDTTSPYELWLIRPSVVSTEPLLTLTYVTETEAAYLPVTNDPPYQVGVGRQ